VNEHLRMKSDNLN